MKTLTISLIALLFLTTASAQNTKYYSLDGIAIKGYDPVAYFLQNKAAKGSANYTYDWSGSKWMFDSQANLDSFKLAPEKYAPQYGGYCALGITENHLAPTDPKAWTIVNNKLYLNYNSKVREYWIIDTARRIISADIIFKELNEEKQSSNK